MNNEEINVSSSEVESVIPAGERNYLKYSGQSSPQKVYLELDCRTGRLDTYPNSEIGNGVPIAVYHGHTQRWTIPCLTNEAADSLIETVRKLSEEIRAGYTNHWNGSNYVASFSDEAISAIDEVSRICEQELDNEPTVIVYSADDWFAPFGTIKQQARELGITAETTDEQLSIIAKKECFTAMGNNIHAIEGLQEHLEWLRDNLKSKDE